MDNKRGSPALPKEGQIVLICDENQPRNSWKMGRVTALNQSKDGIIRDVELINSNGRTIKRSINMIVPLEMDIEDDPKAKPEPKPTPESPKPPEETSKGRYNLRKRKDINYDEDTDANINVITTSLSSLLPTKASSTLFLTLLALMCLTGVTAEKPDVLCNQHGLQLYGQYRNFEACAENYCTSSTRWSWKAGEGQQVWIPPALKIHKHHVTVKVDDGKELHIIEKDCAAVPFCEIIDCTLCWSNIVNPECHIIWAIIGSSILFFFSMLLIHALCYTPIQMKEVVNLCGRAISTVFYCCIGTCRRINPFRRSRISRWRTTITAMSILIMTTQACQEIDMISQLETSCDQDGNCRFYTEETLHLNQAQREGCLRLEKNGKTVKDIRITLVEVELHCQKQTIAFTQEIETRVWSTKRCAHMGSCTGSKCANITRTSRVPELNEVNHFVGATGCAESCGGLGCDCFYPSSGCIFYKIYALPKSVEPVEIFRCLEYTPRATIQVTSTTLNSRINRAESTEFVVPIGKPFEIKDLTINIDTIETPPAPQMNSWFIKKENGVALWPENVYPNYRCGPKLQDCTLVEDCHCSPAEDRMMCTCRDQNLTEIFQRPDTHLPVQSGSTRIEVSGKAIKAKVRNSATSTITVKIKDNWKTSVYRTNEVCTSSTEEIRGCYACEEGVQVNITCTSTRMETMANLDCDSETFAIACSPKGAATTISFRSVYARFRRSCTLDCGGKEKTHLELAGNLKYTGSIWTSIYRIISGLKAIKHIIDLRK
ncbi:hypothetical protein CAEBREN_30684 [Caenorhabditis brenneri]|uniref:Phlebovirus glycoprotein G2 fusion domain-containing protein n=1 Tax=Caenorhabditis brenneri TaxID=135651 RepID=G0NCF8_CAEBE|nr:hypothetical protein CAEBREN_30684 [Caenorhabditis brenneri]